MTTLLIGGAIVTGLVAGAAGTGIAYRKYKKRKALKGNQLFGCPIVSLDKNFMTSDDPNLPVIVSLCCEEVEARNRNLIVEWEEIFRNAIPESVEERKEIIQLIELLSSPKPRKQKKVSLTNLTTPEVIELFLYYLYNIPEPLCMFAFFDEFISAQEEYSRTGNIEIWKQTVVDLLFKLPERHRCAIMRILRMSNSILITLPNESIRDTFLKVASGRLLLAFLSPRSASEECDRLETFGAPCLANLIFNYGDIVGACLHHSVQLEDELDEPIH